MAKRRAPKTPAAPVTLTEAQKDYVREIIGEGFHTAFRKASDHPNADKIWRLIRELPDNDWKDPRLRQRLPVI